MPLLPSGTFGSRFWPGASTGSPATILVSGALRSLNASAKTAPTLNHGASGTWRVGLLASHNFELLDPLARAHLADIEVSLGVDRGVVKMSKFPHLVTHAAETRQNPPSGAIDDFHLLVVFIADEHELLLRIARKAYRHSRAPRTRCVLRPCCVLTPLLEGYRDVLLKVARPIEHLETKGRPVACGNV